MLLGAYVGVLPSEILALVRDSLPVKTAWDRFCPQTEDSRSQAVLEEFDFVLDKWLNCRMGDYARRLSDTSMILISAKAGDAALRTKLRAVSGQSSGGSTNRSTGTEGEGLSPRISEQNRKTGSDVTEAQREHGETIRHIPDIVLNRQRKESLLKHARLAEGNSWSRMTKSDLSSNYGR